MNKLLKRIIAIVLAVILMVPLGLLEAIPLQAAYYDRTAEINGCTLHYRVHDAMEGNYVEILGADDPVDLVIPEAIEGLPVKKIVGNAFFECQTLKSVSVPGSVLNIDSGAFWYCTNLERVELSEGIIIAHSCFAYCSSLKRIVLPGSLTQVGGFKYCTSLEEVIIKEGPTRILDGAFYECSSLKHVEIPNSVTEIEGGYSFKTDTGGTFYKCTSLESITIPDSVVYIGYAFVHCTSLKHVKMSKNVQNAGAFVDVAIEDTDFLLGCNNIKTFPEFDMCNNLKKAVIPNTVTKLVSGTFYKCMNLRELTVLPGPNKVHADEEFIYDCWRFWRIALPSNVEWYGLRSIELNFAYDFMPWVFTEKGSIVDEDAKLKGADIEYYDSSVTPDPFVVSEVEPEPAPKPSKELSHIKITTPPTTTKYKVGNYFNPAGMVVTAYYDDGSSAIVTDYTYSPDGKLEEDDDKVVIEYKEGENTSRARQAITVEAASKTLKKITITSPPNKTKYKEGESFDTNGMKVTATYSDGSKSLVTGYSVSPSTKLSKGVESVTVSYTEGKITKTAEVEVTVTTKKEDSEGDKDKDQTDDTKDQTDDSKDPTGDDEDRDEDEESEEGIKYDFIKSDLKYAIDSSKKTVSLVGFTKQKVTVKIPATVKVNGKVYKVTSISEGAFKGDKIIKTLIIGQNIKVIKNEAFSSCINLKKVTFKNCQIKKIAKDAFYLDGIIKPVTITVCGKKQKTIQSIVKKLQKVGFFCATINTKVS